MSTIHVGDLVCTFKPYPRDEIPQVLILAKVVARSRHAFKLKSDAHTPRIFTADRRDVFPDSDALWREWRRRYAQPTEQRRIA